MAGVKGRSGGPRKNAGGARPGAGRKPKVVAPAKAKKSANAKPRSRAAVKVALEGQPHGGALKRAKAEPVLIEERDMLQLLQDVALGRVDATGLQVKAAIAAVQYTHAKKGEGGKKDEKKKAASDIAGGRFAPTPPPPRARAN